MTTAPTTTTRRPWALLAVALATFMTYLDNNIVNVAHPGHPARPRPHHRRPGVGRERVHPGVRGPAARGWPARRRLRPPPAVPARTGCLHPGLGDRRARGLGRGARRRPGRAGSRRRARHADDARDHQPRLPRPAKQRTAAIGIWAGVGGLALAVGPLLGGLLSQHASWGWIFEINAPIGVATTLLGAWAITESRDAVRRPLDLPGIAISVVGLTALTWALIEGASRGWTSAPILVCLRRRRRRRPSAFVVVEQRATDPMVSLPLFRVRAFTGGTIALMLWAFGLFGIYFFTSIYLQQVLAFSPTEAGLAFLPMAATLVTFAVLSERIAAWAGPHRAGHGGHGAHGRRDRHRRPARRRLGLPLAHAELRPHRHRRRADHPAHRGGHRGHAAGAGGRGVRAVQRLAGDRGPARHHRHRRGALGPLGVRRPRRRRCRSTRSCPGTSSGCWSRPRWSPSAASRPGSPCATRRRSRRSSCTAEDELVAPLPVTV